MKTLKQQKQKGLSDSTASSIVVAIYRFQCKWANWMHHNSERLNARTKFYCLFGFIMAGVGLTGSHTYQVLYQKNLRSIRTSSITQPYLLQPAAKTPSISVDLERMRRYEHLVDSLSKIPVGDSILKYRPALADSLKKTDELYRSQHLQNPK